MDMVVMIKWFATGKNPVFITKFKVLIQISYDVYHLVRTIFKAYLDLKIT